MPVAANQTHNDGFLEGEHAPPVVFLFIDPPRRVEGPGYLGGVQKGGRLERRLDRTGVP